MKGLKPTMLALCVAGAAPAAMAFQPLDEISMGNITGQAGVTIELETRLNIDRFIYTDEGSLEINDIFVGGANRTDMFSEMNVNLVGQASDRLDNIRVNIDIASDGDAIINLLPLSFNAVDFRMTTGAWNLTGTDGSTTIMDNFEMDMLIGSGTIRVDTATDTLRLLTDIAIDDMDFDIPFLAMGIRDLRLTGADYDLQAPQPLRLFATVDLDIFKGANAAGTEVLAIEMDSFRADLSIGGVLIGGTSIGSVMLDDLAITNTSMRIYGH
ncbi:DUF6160 family protein [Marinobacter sp.]|uniref:DUF6160 family protein n=1 Tax=Marinobacter sp. TaxID=50741 RepID=UPI000C60206E|nr:DUF6160 family protein [Marinobacter sp.]MAO12916.1 hypothetical protein [Marinobacter sp.]|tara:strand:- start:50 stop:856 length:807 start_codon:yes stop_codon:yes gene_type:complete